MAPSSRLAAVLLALTIALSLAAAQVPPPPPPPLSPPPPPAVPGAAPPPTGNGSSCDTLKLHVCASLLNGLLGVLVPGGGNAGNSSQCCPLLGGLVDLDAAVCLCTAIRANVLGIVNLDVPLALRLLLNQCNKAVPDGFTCAPA